MNFSASIYQPSGNLRSSDIYSDEEFGCRFHFFRILFCTGGSVRQSVRSLEARELYMPSKKSASSPTRNGLVSQKSMASPHHTFPLRGLSASSSWAFFLVPILLQFPATAGPRVANMMMGESHWFLERRYET